MKKTRVENVECVNLRFQHDNIFLFILMERMVEGKSSSHMTDLRLLPVSVMQHEIGSAHLCDLELP